MLVLFSGKKNYAYRKLDWLKLFYLFITLSCILLLTDELRLSANHTVTEYEMSGEPYNQKSGWIIRKRTLTPLYLRAPFPGIYDPPVHLDVYLENSLIYMMLTSALLNYRSPLFRKNKSALSYYGSAQT